MVFACAGHVLVDLPVFGGPIVMLIGWVLYVARRERSRTDSAELGESAPAPASSLVRGAG